jgi:hypothetical protein
LANKLQVKSNNEMIECMQIKNNLDNRMREKSIRHELVVQNVQSDMHEKNRLWLERNQKVRTDTELKIEKEREEYHRTLAKTYGK